jgi:hypothetical protein
VASCDDYGGCAYLDKCLYGSSADGLYRQKPERVYP